MSEEVVRVARQRSAPASPDVHPEVALGEAQGRLERAYTFGSDADIAQARAVVDEARSRVGAAVASRHAALIRETAKRLMAGRSDEPRQSPLELAVAGLVSFPALVAAWQQEPRSLGLQPDEAELAEKDHRNLRLVVLARQERRPLDELVQELEVHDVGMYALAARADGSVDEQALSDWLTTYLRESERNPDS